MNSASGISMNFRLARADGEAVGDGVVVGLASADPDADGVAPTDA